MLCASDESARGLRCRGGTTWQVRLSRQGHRVGFVLMRDPWVEIDAPTDYVKAKGLFERA